jgi:Methyltransferase FkbM domain
MGSFDRGFILGFRDRIPDVETRLVRIEVPCLTLESLCRKHEVTNLDLLVIDAEGHEWSIIHSIDFSTRHPRLLIFEHLHLSESDRALCGRFLGNAGYDLSSLGVDTWCLDTRVPDSLTSLWRDQAEAEADPLTN